MKISSLVGTNDVIPPVLFIHSFMGGLLCIVHAAKEECTPRNFMILSVPLMPGNAHAAGNSSIPPF